MRVLIIHTEYQHKGGEDIVVAEEMDLLTKNGVIAEMLKFSNEGRSILKFLQLPFNIGSYLKTKKRISKFKPDIVHVHNLHFAASASVIYAIKNCHLPCILTLHNYRLLCPSGTLFLKGNIFLASLKSRFPWEAVRVGAYKNSKLLTFWLSVTIWMNRLLNIYAKVDRFIMLTDHSRQIMVDNNWRLQHDKLVVKPNFISETRTPNEKRNNGFLYVGRLSEEKGISILLEAFKDSPYHLTIIGDGPMRDEVISFSEKHDYVTYLGFLDRQAITLELKKCSALVFPSIWYETFGLTIIEAFATSTTVIASNIGAPSTIISNRTNGLLFEASNVNDFKLKMRDWQGLEESEKEQYRSMARETYERHYTPKENFAQLMSVYNSVMNQGIFSNKMSHKV